MKKIKFIVAILGICMLSSCINIEERIEINNDNSGNYSLSIDLSKLMSTLAQMSPGDTAKLNKKIDSLIVLKECIDTASNLTPAEKALYRNSTLAIKVDEPNNIFKMKVFCPFANMADLAIVKKNLFSVLGNLGITKNAAKSLLSGQSLPATANIGSASKSGSPSSRFFAFASAPGKISYTVTDKAGLDKEMASDSIMQMKQMSMLMGDFSYNTTFVLPSAVKKFSGPGSSISADKKTVTFKRTFDDLTGNQENLEYKIEY